MTPLPPGGDAAWRQLLANTLGHGEAVAPRGQPTREVLHTQQLRCRLGQPVVTSPARRLNYRFMAAEALWILAGDNRLAPLTRFVERMADFSDDGKTLAGAYGPRVVPQLPYVIDALLKDPNTRQAVIGIWTPNPEPSKDIPCTLSLGFSLRGHELHCHAQMRSSDVWLGIPYDIFSFSCVAFYVTCMYNLRVREHRVLPGQLTITATSSHLYERDVDKARSVLATPPSREVEPVPEDLVLEGAWDLLKTDLEALRDEHRGCRHWRPRP